MSEVTIEAIAKLLKEEFKIELDPIKATLAEHTKILNIHTAALDQLLTEKKNREDEKIVNVHRFERLERWAVQAGEKLGIKLEL
jgi:hypothetical protein